MTELIVQEPVIVEPDKTQEELDKLKLELDQEKKAKSGLVEELKAERKRRQELEVKPPEPKDEVDLKIQEALKGERDRIAVGNKEIARKVFQEANKEFDSGNDPSGLKMAALEREFNSFNTNELSTIEEFTTVFQRAKRLLSQDSRPDDSVVVTPDATTPNSPSTPRTRVDSKLSPEEQQVLKQLGWTEERYLKVKLAQPDFVSKLLKTK